MNTQVNVHLRDDAVIDWRQYGTDSVWIEVAAPGSDLGICGTDPKHLRQLAEAAMAAAIALEAAQDPCVGGDPLCPCREGALCHYVDDPVGGTPAWPLPHTVSA